MNDIIYSNAKVYNYYLSKREIHSCFEPLGLNRNEQQVDNKNRFSNKTRTPKRNFE